jgi:hypothetical protein
MRGESMMSSLYIAFEAKNLLCKGDRNENFSMSSLLEYGGAV